MSEQSWRWKVGESEANSRLGLLYEPGNWGDLLKGAWALALLEPAAAWRGRGGERALRWLDPFAGRPLYPLLPAAAARLERLGASASDLAAALRPFLERRSFPSTAALAAAAATANGLGFEAWVWDAQGEARDAWEREPGARILAVEDGWAAVGAPAARESDVVLVDPYDFFDAGRAALAALAALAAERPVLVYTYNKAPRGGGFARAQRDRERGLREALRAQPGVAALVGRVAADARLPRAWHEALLLAPSALLEREGGALPARLRARAVELATALARDGAFEELRSE